MTAGVPVSRDELFLQENLGDSYTFIYLQMAYPDSKVHGANMEPTWVPGGPHVGPMKLAICVCNVTDAGRLSHRKCSSWPQKTLP